MAGILADTMKLDSGQKMAWVDLVSFNRQFKQEELVVTTHIDPNGAVDAPVKRQILMVLLGFVAITTIIAIVVNSFV